MIHNSSPINLESIIGFLLETEIFSHLSASELSEMTTILEFKRYSKGEVVFSEGDIGDAWYVVYEGNVAVNKHVPFQRDSKVAVLPAPSVFGEMAILSSTPRSATIVAHDEVILMRFARRKFERMLEEGKLSAYKLVLGMGIVLSDRYRGQTRQLAQLVQRVDELETQLSEGESTDLFDRTDMFEID